MKPSPQTSGKKIENYIFSYNDFLGNGNFSKCYKAKNTITSFTLLMQISRLL